MAIAEMAAMNTLGVMTMRTAEGLCEIVFDISTTVQTQLDKLDEPVRDWMWDDIEGSRGLFWNHVLPWAREYQAMWEKLSDAEKDAKDYLSDVDTFAARKFALLLASMPPDVASIQVVPIIEDSDEKIDTPQFEGPTAETSYWGVYLRGRDGHARWVADALDERTAMLLGRSLAVEHGVKIEPQPWKEPKTTEVVVPAPQKSFRVSWMVDVYADSPRHAAEVARSLQVEPDTTALVFSVTPPGNRPVVHIDLAKDTNE